MQIYSILVSSLKFYSFCIRTLVPEIVPTVHMYGASNTDKMIDATMWYIWYTYIQWFSKYVYKEGKDM